MRSTPTGHRCCGPRVFTLRSVAMFLQRPLKAQAGLEVECGCFSPLGNADPSRNEQEPKPGRPLQSPRRLFLVTAHFGGEGSAAHLAPVQKNLPVYAAASAEHPKAKARSLPRSDSNANTHSAVRLPWAWGQTRLSVRPAGVAVPIGSAETDRVSGEQMTEGPVPPAPLVPQADTREGYGWRRPAPKGYF